MNGQVADVAEWEPLPNIPWVRPLVASVILPRATFDARFGAPQQREMCSNGWGPFDAWGLRFACGLEVAIWVFLQDADGRRIDDNQAAHVEIYTNRDDAEHVLFHLAVGPHETTTFRPGSDHQPSEWRLMRQDEQGNVFEVSSHSSRCVAEAVRETFERRGHKQLYWVVAPPPPEQTPRAV